MPYDSCGAARCSSPPSHACSYSPNLSRRCTHLAVPVSALLPPAGGGGGGGAVSDKLRSALRNRHKWGLEVVDLR